MTSKIIIPAALMLVLMAGQVGAQPVGGADSYQTGAPIPLAPGNPNSSTIVTPEVPSSPMVDDSVSSSDDAKVLDSVMPSSGGSPSNIYGLAPSNMDYAQFTSYLDKQWGVNGNAQITARQWNTIDPAYFGGHKPSFDSLAPGYGSSADERDLQSVYSSLYQRYLQYSSQNNYTTP